MSDSESTGSVPSMLFIVGCPRSGTTWTQLLLAQHPSVATSQETHLFDNYIGVLDECWRGEAATPTRRATGLRSLLSEEEFYGLCRDFATGVIRRIEATNPDAQIVVEKSPQHVKRGELISHVFPDARLLHVIRDPRNVVCSLREAGRSWGADWAPSSTAGCAEVWTSQVRSGREIRDVANYYREIRYEDLQEDAAGELGALLDWVGLDYQEGFCSNAAETCRIEKLQSAAEEVSTPWSLEDEPDGMYRKGKRDGWREELTSSELRIIEYVARDLMRSLGYEPASSGYDRRPLYLAARAEMKGLAALLRPIWKPVLDRLDTAAKTASRN